MNPVPVGSRIRVVSNSNSHDYTVGKTYVVSTVDDDGTFKAKDPATGSEGNWLRWRDCEPGGGIGWDFCKKVLPAEMVAFLSAFEGVDQLRLSDEVKDKILTGMPDLYERILEASAELSAERSEAADED